MKGPGDWKEIRRDRVADCRIFEVERSIARSPVDQTEHEYFRVRSPDWAQIVPVTPEGEVVMVRQYRHGASKQVLEIPGGLVEPGEAPVDAAIRECLEETGYAAESVVGLGSLNPNPAIHDHRLHSFYATGVRRVAEIQQTPTEQTTVELLPLAEIRERVLAGEIDHMLVVATLWRFLDEISDGR